MRNAFLDTADDMQWLRETHLKGVALPSKWAGFKSAIMQGNEDSPHAVNLYLDPAPLVSSDYLRVTFQHQAPIYCEYQEFKGEGGHAMRKQDYRHLVNCGV